MYIFFNPDMDLPWQTFLGTNSTSDQSYLFGGMTQDIRCILELVDVNSDMHRSQCEALNQIQIWITRQFLIF